MIAVHLLVLWLHRVLHRAGVLGILCLPFGDKFHPTFRALTGLVLLDLRVHGASIGQGRLALFSFHAGSLDGGPTSLSSSFEGVSNLFCRYQPIGPALSEATILGSVSR